MALFNGALRPLHYVHFGQFSKIERWTYKCLFVSQCTPCIYQDVTVCLPWRADTLTNDILQKWMLQRLFCCDAL